MKLGKGSWVRLKHPPRIGPQQAQIIDDERPGIARGAVYLSAPLGGYRWWSKGDLVLCERLT